MLANNPGVVVRLDRLKVRRAHDLWETKILPFMLPGTDPSITMEFAEMMRDLRNAVEEPTDDR